MGLLASYDSWGVFPLPKLVLHGGSGPFPAHFSLHPTVAVLSLSVICVTPMFSQIMLIQQLLLHTGLIWIELE